MFLILFRKANSSLGSGIEDAAPSTVMVIMNWNKIRWIQLTTTDCASYLNPPIGRCRKISQSAQTKPRSKYKVVICWQAGFAQQLKIA
jgi:hypothetical protein